MGDIGVTVNLQPIADQSQLINAAIGGDFQAVTWRNHPGGDPDTQYVWWYNGKDADGNSPTRSTSAASTTRDQQLLDEGRTTPTRPKRKTIYEDLNKRFADQLWNIWAWYTIWSIASQPNVHGCSGPTSRRQRPVPGSRHRSPVSGIWVSK